MFDKTELRNKIFGAKNKMPLYAYNALVEEFGRCASEHLNILLWKK